MSRHRLRSSNTIARWMLLVVFAALDASLARGLLREGHLDWPIIVILIVLYDALCALIFLGFRHILRQKHEERRGAALLFLLGLVLFPMAVPCFLAPIFLLVLETWGVSWNFF